MIVALILSGCASDGGSGDWYYHWDCHGDPECLATNPTGAPAGTLNEGPQQVDCTSLMEFARRFWGAAAVNSCDQSPTGAAAAPAITGLSPSSGVPGTVVTLTGANLTGATVTINGVSASCSATATQLVCTIPQMGAFTGPLVVTTAGGTANSGSFTVTAATQGGGGEVFLNGLSSGTVAVFGRTANGNVAPLRAIHGAATGLTGPISTSVDPVRGELFVLDAGSPTLLVFDRLASGNVAPLRSLQVGGAQLLRADPVNGEIAVLGSQLSFYASTATSTAAPLRTLQVLPTSGVSTSAYGVAIDAVNDEVLILTGNSTSQDLGVAVYARTATGIGVAKRRLTAFGAQATGYAGLAVDTVNDELWVTSGGPQGTRVFSRTAFGTAVPLRSTTLAGSAVYVDPANNEVGLSALPRDPVGFTVISRTTLAPLRSVAGTQTGLSGEGNSIDFAP
ncbi:MAG TPA: IPT/TIG domain-containing protein [Myxococcales bacterium]|nr:IPT/TIG domain-containing protein [Myxococcales bacterium]